MWELSRLKGKGTAIGPDLTGIGRLGPQAIAMAAHSTVTQYVQVVKLKWGDLPGDTGKKDDKTVVLFDLSKTPPEKKEVAASDIGSMNGNDVWKHPRANKMSSEQFADTWRTSSMRPWGLRRRWIRRREVRTSAG